METIIPEYIAHKGEAVTKRQIRPKAEIAHLLIDPPGEDTLVKRNADVEDTLALMAREIPQTLHHTKKIANHLKGKTLYETCKNIWRFVYAYVDYKKDEKGKEQVKSPARTLKDQAGDCDDMTGLISSTLLNLKIKHALRRAKYWWSKDEFKHVYVIVPTDEQGNYITIDCVPDKFNYEEPTTEVIDTIMDLYYLNGIENPSVDWDDLQGGNLGKLELFSKIGKVIKTGLNAINKINPATALLRVGVLGSMKLNIMGVAEKLRYAYLSEEEAKRRGFDPGKFQKLKKIREKMEGIFYGAGGKPENLKEAILTGKGNANKEVGGFESNYNTPIRELIGERVYNDETNSLQGLGEPVTGAALAAASTIMASISALLKAIGDLRAKDTGAMPGPVPTETMPTPPMTPEITQPPLDILNDPMLNINTGENLPMQRTTDTTIDPPPPPPEPEEKTGWEKWKKPVIIGSCVLVGGIIVYKLATRNSGKEKRKGSQAMAGFRQTKKRKKRYFKRNSKKKIRKQGWVN